MVQHHASPVENLKDAAMNGDDFNVTPASLPNSLQSCFGDDTRAQSRNQHKIATDLINMLMENKNAASYHLIADVFAAVFICLRHSLCFF